MQGNQEPFAPLRHQWTCLHISPFSAHLPFHISGFWCSWGTPWKRLSFPSLCSSHHTPQTSHGDNLRAFLPPPPLFQETSPLWCHGESVLSAHGLLSMWHPLQALSKQSHPLTSRQALHRQELQNRTAGPGSALFHQFSVIWRCIFEFFQGSTQMNCQGHLNCCPLTKCRVPKKQIEQKNNKTKKQAWQTLWTPPHPQSKTSQELFFVLFLVCFCSFWFTPWTVS